MTAVPDDDPAILAAEMRTVLGQLVRRLRAQSAFPMPQGAVLGHLDREGPMGVSDLAARNRVRPQSMAQTVGDLEAAGMVTRRPDPSDGRRQLVELTPSGRERLLRNRRDRDDWFARVVSAELSAAERATLHESMALLRRIADDERH